MPKFEDHPLDGINLFKVGFNDNFDLEKETLLGLIDGKVSSMKFMNERIESHVTKILKNIRSEDIYRYKYDSSKRMERVSTASEGSMMEAAIRRRLSFLDKMKLAITKRLMKNPPYGHPTLTPLKERERYYYLPKNPDQGENYQEIN